MADDGAGMTINPFTWLFKHSRDTYAHGELVFGGEFGTFWWPAALVLAVLVLAVLSFAFARRLAGWTVGRRATIHGLQLAAIAVLLTIIARPALEITRLVPGTNTVAMLVDTSASMALPAAAGAEQTRLAIAERLLEADLAAAVGGTELARFRFDERLAPLAPTESVAAIGERSRLVDALTALASDYDPGAGDARSLQALAAIVALTDGAQNGGDGTDLRPLAAAGVPVHLVAIGPADVARDVELAEFALPRSVAPHTEVTARVVIRQPLAQPAELPREARLRIFAGESLLAAETVTLAPGTRTFTKNITFGSGPADVKELTAEVVPTPDDPLPENNRRTRLMEAMADSHRVLYLEGEPRWEFKFIRRALSEDDGIELVTWLRTTPRKTYRQGVTDAQELADGFPATVEALFEYDLLILGSLPATALGDAQHQWLEDFVAHRGGSVLALAGREALAEGGWDVKPVARALPVALERRAPEAPPAYRSGEYAAQPAQDAAGRGIANLGGETAEERLANWRSLPPLADHHRLGRAKPGATVVLEARDGSSGLPLLIVQPYGRGQSAVLATATTWRWQMRTPPTDQRHARFWRQLTRHLAASAPPRQRLAVESADGALHVRVALKDARFDAIQGAEVRARVTAPGGQAVDVPLLAAEDGTFAETVAAPAPGIYRVEVSPRASGRLAAPGSVEAGPGPRLARVGEESPEHFGAALNEALLARIAEATGGQVWRPDALDGLRDAIAFGAAGVRERHRLPLWNAPFFFLLLVFLKCLEWLLRRRWGSI